jgi:hypothetical protein
LSLQPVGVSCPPSAHIGPNFLQSVPETGMSSNTRGLLGANSKIRSASVADCKSVPNSPQLKQHLLVSKF